MKRTVLVTNAGRTSAIAFIRSLGRKGWHVIAADSDARSAGFHSRHASERFVYPAPMRSPQAFVESLRRFAHERQLDFIVPVTDECIHPLAHARASFEPRTRLAMARDEALALVADKWQTIELARQLEVPVPETRVARTRAEAHAAARELAMPVVIKPVVSRLYLPEEDRILVGAVSFARDLAEMDRRLEAFDERQQVLLQSYVPGTGVGVECLAREGQVLLAFQHRRLAEIPVCGGASAWRESVPLDPVLFEHARRLIEALRWNGLIMVEFKLGERPWLLEINGRVWGSLPLACMAGVDFPGELAELYFPGSSGAAPGALNGAAGPGVPRTDYRSGVRAYNFELMLSWITQVLLGLSHHPFLPRPGRDRALAGLLCLLDPAQKSDLADMHDLSPRLAEARRILRRVTSKLAGTAAVGKL